MKLTDVERELRATLVEAGRRARVPDDLEIRVVQPVRRRRAWLAAGVASVSIGLAGVLIAVMTTGGGNDTVVSTPTPATTPSGLASALIGAWRPVDIVGFDRSKLTVAHSTKAAITFGMDGKWSGTDGCNRVGGTYRAADNGSITADAGAATTLMSCDNVPNRGALELAARFKIDGRSLTLYAADGSGVASYEKK